MKSRTIDWTEGDLRRVIEVDERSRARTTNFEHEGRPLLAAGWSSVAIGWRLVVDGEVLHGASEAVEFVGLDTAPAPTRHAGAATDRILRHRARTRPVAIDLHVRSFADAPAQLQWLEVRNEGDRPLLLSDMQSLELPLTPAPLERIEVFRDFCSTPAHGDHYGGMDDPAIRIDDPETGRGLFLIHLGPGLVRRSIVRLGYTPLSTLGYDTARFPVEVELAPGASFAADPVGLLAYGRDPSGSLRAFAARHLAGRPRSAGDFALRVYRAIERIAERWRRERPGLLVDLTYELWGGHHAADYALLRAGDLVWLSNVLDTAGLGAPRAARRLAFHRARCLPPERLLVGNLRADGPDPLASAASSLASVPLLLGDLRSVSPREGDGIRRVFEAYRRTRDEYGLDCFEALESTGRSWDGFYRGDGRGNGLLALFRNGAGAATPASMPLPASARGALDCRDLFEGRRFVSTAEELRRGALVPLADGASLALLEVRAR